MTLDSLLAEAVRLGASDIHLKLGRPPLVRLDGTIVPLAGAVALTEADLDVCLRDLTAAAPGRYERLDETGDLDVAYSPAGLPRFRVNAFRQRGAVSFAFRVIPREAPRFADLGLPAVVERLAEEHRGLVLVTGATGSGKTTTLAAMIDHINRTRRSHIVTIEDPIEVLHADHESIVNQREVGLDTESFGQALRRALRQDPDTIMIGELRDAETAQTALHAAESGHLVFSTLHTTTATETVNRIVDFFPPHQHRQIRLSLASALTGTICQRLIPRADGKGRVPALEVMVVNGRIQQAIADPLLTSEIDQIIADGEYYGMQTFDQALVQLLANSEIDLREAMNAASNPHDLKVMLERLGIVPTGRGFVSAFTP